MKSTIGTGHTMKSNVIYPMAEATNSESFEEVVEWAYGTLPLEIRDLPDFPGIQVADEPRESSV
jgi:predicted Zn-dependent protease with MMP-like domain